MVVKGKSNLFLVLQKMSIGERIKEIRVKLGLSQAEMAKSAKVAMQSLQAWEYGKSEPNIKNLAGLSQDYMVSLDWILDGSGTMFKSGVKSAVAVLDSGDPIPYNEVITLEHITIATEIVLRYTENLLSHSSIGSHIGRVAQFLANGRQRTEIEDALRGAMSSLKDLKL